MGQGKFVAQLNSGGQYEISVGLRERTIESLEGRLINAPTGNGGNLSDAAASRTGYDASRLKQRQLQQSLPKPDLTGLTPEQKELVLDLTQVGLSVIGIFDPTGIADGADAVVSLGRGDYWGAGISALGIIPYLGDIAKIGKLPKLLKIIDNVVAMAKADTKFAKVVEPLLKGLKGAIDKLPIDKLPNWAKEPIRSMKNKLDEFFNAARKGKLTIEAGRTLSVSEQKIADKLVSEGKNVTARVESTVSGVKNPDFEVDGVITEFKHVSDLKGIDAERLSKGLSGRILDGASQAKYIILDVADQPGMTKEAAERAAARAYGRLRQLGSDAVTQVRIIGKNFDITIPFTVSK